MSWDNITGDARILPGGGGQNEIKFENGKAKKLRLLLPNDSQPYSYFEHCLEVETFEGGQLVRVFRTIRCPKTSKNPTAHCPLCDGQQVRRRTRHACNVWDYDTNSVQKLNAGDSVFKPIATTRKMGVDVLGLDWAMMKTGEGRNDTEYTTTNLGPTPFELPEGTQLYDIEAEYAPHSIEEMKAIVEGAGGNWDALIIPPQLQYPTLADALKHVMPNGKYKDQTMEQIWESDKSPRGMISFLALKSDRISPEKAAAQVILSRLGGVHIDGVPADDSGATATPTATPTPTAPATNTAPTSTPADTSAPANTTPTSTTPTAPATTTAPIPVSDDRQAKINEINSLLSTKEKYVKGGFKLIVETMKECSGGKTNITDFTDEELDKMLETCKSA